MDAYKPPPKQRRSPICMCGCKEKLGEERLCISGLGEFNIWHWPTKRTPPSMPSGGGVYRRGGLIPNNGAA